MPCCEDVRKIKGKDYGTVDILTGGFPCQDLSYAGKLAGIRGERSGLWKEMYRIIGEIRPRYAIMENVTALLTGESGEWFSVLLSDLAEVGYNAEWHCIQAANIGAPHRRDRVWVIAYPESQNAPEPMGLGGILAQGDWETKKWRESWELFKLESESMAPTKWWDSGQSCCQPLLVRNDDGVPNKLDRSGACGNAIVPQVAEVIFRAIKEIDQ